MIETYLQPLPHGMTLSCRAAGARGRPVLVFLHGFPEAAFVWDELLEHFAHPDHGGYRCVAPNLRGYEKSSTPAEPEAYRPKHLVQDIAALIQIEGGQLACLVAHDWGGAVAWSLANKMPQLARKLAIINSPHPGTFLRELQSNPRQQAASDYMNFLTRPDAAQLLAEDDYRRLWKILTNTDGSVRPREWLSDDLKAQYRAVWNGPPGSPPGTGLIGGCNYYRASPLRPPRDDDAAAAAVSLPHAMLTVGLPTLVLWALNDIALLPELVDGLDAYIPDLTLETREGATHWIVHEQPQWIAERLGAFLQRPV